MEYGMEWSEASFRKRMWDVGGGLFGWVFAVFVLGRIFEFHQNGGAYF